jgi:DNA-binding SARP family transcriptional activator
MTSLRVSLLGGCQISFEGQPWPTLSPLKLASLFACLLLHRQQPVERDQLATWLWPSEDDPEARRANLRRHLHLLRQALPAGEWFLTDRETVQWNPAAECWLDVEEFSRITAQCTGSGPAAACDACLEMYQGDLLPELYDDWLIPEREALRGLLLQALEKSIAYFVERGEYATALRYARRLLIFDPLHEETHRMVMRLHYLNGDQSAALRQYEECATLLQRELNVEPMPATRQLQQVILEGHPLPEAAPSSFQTTTSSSGTPPPTHARVATRPVSGRRRRWLWLLAAVILATLVVVVYLNLRPASSPHFSLVITGPTVVQDTWITENFPNNLYWPEDPDRTPHEKYSRSHMQYYEQHAPDRILIHFDLDQLPANISVEQATFEIHLETWIEMEGTGALTQTYPAQIGVFRILVPWQAEQATFNQPWTQPGLQSGVDVEQLPLDVQSIDGTAWLKFDVTKAVQEWLRRPESNHGLMVIITEAPKDVAHYWVDTTDQGTSTLRPFLNISYLQR